MSSNTEGREKIRNVTEKALNLLEVRTAAATDLEIQFAEIQKKFEEAATIKDEHQRDLRMKVLKANFDELRKDSNREEQDLAQAVFGLNAMLESMGEEYSELGTMNDDEKSLVQTAEKNLEEAKKNRILAETKWFFKHSSITQADAEISTLQARLDEAKIEARRLARQRLLTANLDASLQEFMVRVQKTVQIMQRRMGEIDNQLKKVSERKQSAFAMKQQAATALEQLDKDLNVREEELKKEEEALLAVESGTALHAEQSKKISDLRAEVERIRGERNTAFVLHQSKDKFAAELEIHEKTQMKLRDNQRMWITSLKSDTEERVVTFRSRLEAMKAAADQDVAKSLDDLGAEADQRNAEYMARVGAASDRMRMEKIEKHPKRIAEIAAVAAAQAEAVQQIRVREQAAIEEFKRLYGIDPTASSFFHYQKDQAGGEKEDDTAGVF